MNTLVVPEIDFPAGICHFVATPIGNLGDIGLRALGVLSAAEVVFAEDTRHTRRLLDHYGIRAPMVSYHDHNKSRVVPQIVDRLQAGQKVAVVSDAGMPCVSDPGYSLIKALQEANLTWTVIPGPSSTLAALVLSGFPTDRFLFVGYPPRKKGQRSTFLAKIMEEQGTVLILESCHRIQSTLELLAGIAPERPLAIAREITKLHEETLKGTASELQKTMTGSRLKGELVLVVKGLGRKKNREE
ncbi:MAG: 16S rRNA (cytidine(1402)-2'-O)-methyltransferase [Gemmatimonadales bacterium]|nr:16S rRNA (cytidine(1402)-2'-O)-methyltransferase [Gemmatimonadales bacterium]